MNKRMVRWFAAEFGLVVAVSFAVAAVRELRLGQQPGVPADRAGPLATEERAAAEVRRQPQPVA
jgi:hypothetical protein